MFFIMDYLPPPMESEEGWVTLGALETLKSDPPLLDTSLRDEILAILKDIVVKL